MSNLFLFDFYSEIFPLNSFVCPSVFGCMVEHMLIIRNSVQVFATVIRAPPVSHWFPRCKQNHPTTPKRAKGRESLAQPTYLLFQSALRGTGDPLLLVAKGLCPVPWNHLGWRWPLGFELRKTKIKFLRGCERNLICKMFALKLVYKNMHSQIKILKGCWA